MKIFLDTANIEAIKKYMDLGILDGITTNPSLLLKENSTDPIDTMKKIVKLVDGPVSLEVVATGFDEMIDESMKLVSYGDNVVVKIPMGNTGLKVINCLYKKGIKTNVTLIFSANQALLAAKAVATYVSPFIGRLDDIGHDGLNLIGEIVEIFSNYDIPTEVLVASIRHPIHVIESAKLGANVATMPPEILQKMINHSLTDKGLDIFLKDWEKLKKDYPNLKF
jgi:transaldolase